VLLDHGADFGRRGRDGSTPLEVALAKKNACSVKLLEVRIGLAHDGLMMRPSGLVHC
jgi:hypothetical protein